MRGCDHRRQALAVRIGGAHCFCYGIPVVGQQRSAHLHRGVADAFEDLEHVRLAVDVTLEHFPVINPRMARLARVTNHELALNFGFVDSQMFAIDSIQIEMDAGS